MDLRWTLDATLGQKISFPKLFARRPSSADPLKSENTAGGSLNKLFRMPNMEIRVHDLVSDRHSNFAIPIFNQVLLS